jgi:hypothetical protein
MKRAAMCDCSKGRTGAPRAGVWGQGVQEATGRALFEYVGPTALTVFGPASGRRYRFGGPGATLAVDPRDHAALHTVPQLRARL